MQRQNHLEEAAIEAIKTNRLDDLKRIIQTFKDTEQFNFFYQDQKGKNFLHHALESSQKSENHTAIINFLLGEVNSYSNYFQSVWFNQLTNQGKNIFHVAIKFENKEFLPALFDRIVAIDKTLFNLLKEVDRKGQTILHQASFITDEKNRQDIFTFLIKKLTLLPQEEYFDILMQKTVRSTSVLHRLARFDTTLLGLLFDTLLNFPFNQLKMLMNLPAANGNTVLHILCLKNEVVWVEKFLRYGASNDFLNRNNELPFDLLDPVHFIYLGKMGALIEKNIPRKAIEVLKDQEDVLLFGTTYNGLPVAEFANHPGTDVQLAIKRVLALRQKIANKNQSDESEILSNKALEEQLAAIKLHCRAELQNQKISFETGHAKTFFVFYHFIFGSYKHRNLFRDVYLKLEFDSSFRDQTLARTQVLEGDQVIFINNYLPRFNREMNKLLGPTTESEEKSCIDIIPPNQKLISNILMNILALKENLSTRPKKVHTTEIAVGFSILYWLAMIGTITGFATDFALRNFDDCGDHNNTTQASDDGYDMDMRTTPFLSNNTHNDNESFSCIMATVDPIGIVGFGGGSIALYLFLLYAFLKRKPWLQAWLPENSILQKEWSAITDNLGKLTNIPELSSEMEKITILLTNLRARSLKIEILIGYLTELEHELPRLQAIIAERGLESSPSTPTTSDMGLFSATKKSAKNTADEKGKEIAGDESESENDDENTSLLSNKKY